MRWDKGGAEPEQGRKETLFPGAKEFSSGKKWGQGGDKIRKTIRRQIKKKRA
jgi:hypothetical protein